MGDQFKNNLNIEDFKMNEPAAEHAVIQANKFLANWLIEHWMKKRRMRKSLILKNRALFYGNIRRGVR